MFSKIETKESTIERIKREGKVIPFMFDPIFKSILKDNGMKGILAFLISEITGLDETYVKENIDFKDNELRRYRYLEKGKITDLIVYIKDNIINIEANQILNSGIFDKNNSYHHKIAGEKRNNHKDSLIIQINIDKKNDFDKLITKFQLKDESGKYIIDDKFINYHVNIDNVLKREYNIEKLTRFEKILLLMVTEDKKTLRKISKNDKEMEYMVDRIEEMALNDGIVGLYDKEKAMERVNAINKEADIAEGISQGLIQGEKNKQIEIAKNLLKENISIDIIQRATSLSKNEIEKLSN